MPRRTFTESAVSTEAAPAGTASEKQVAFITSLLNEKDLRAGGKVTATDDELPAIIESMKAKASTLTIKDASAWITRLLDLPKTANVQQVRMSSPEVADGRYAVDSSTIGDGNDSGIRFYRVRTPEEGKWAGFTFVDAQASDDLHPIRNRAHRSQILKAIAADPIECLQRYGHELGCCGVCARTLTDETSRAIGIGPVCRERMGL